MKRITMVPVLVFVLHLPLTTLGWTGVWNNLYPFGGHNCDPIQPGSLIQLIHAGDDFQQDDPIEWINSQPNLRHALNDWLAAGCPPVGDDTLRDETVFMDYGPGYEGYFGKSISGPDPAPGFIGPWYTRFFTAPEGEMAVGDWYGEVGDPEDPNDPIYYGYWSGDEVEITDYEIHIQGVCADKQMKCIPEPATILIASLALLLALLRKESTRQ
jgi:hypothetical protein